MKRRAFLKGISALGGLGMLLGGYAWQIEPFRLEFVRLKMPIKNLPQSLVGKKLMQISDMHIGNRFDRKYIIDSFQKAQAFEPDLVMYTGDFVSYESEEQFKQLEEVFEHVVIGSVATVGVLGNHDYGKNWAQNEVADNIVSILQNKGIRLLRNEQATFEGLTITGLDDYWSRNYNPEVLNTLRHEEANLVLCHNPDVADEPVWGTYKGWILAGHTHGGQCKPPFLSPPMLPVKNKKYTCGKFDLQGDRTLYINRALGHLWQIRFNVRPEITIFELQKA